MLHRRLFGRDISILLFYPNLGYRENLLSIVQQAQDSILNNIDSSIEFGVTDLRTVARLLGKQRIVALSGAGISHDSGLPIANELTDVILRYLHMSQDSMEVLAHACPPFELIIETLAGCSDVSHLYEIFRSGTPCLFHYLCAQLSLDGMLAAIVTTNFDMLFETALDTIHIPYVSIWQEAEFDTWVPSIGRLPLVKIHGSAHDYMSLGITIRRVANQRGVRTREAALRKAFLETSADFILVAGYSGSDRFDLTPALGRLAPSAPPVVLVAHTGGRSNSALVEPLTNHTKAGPFSKFRGIRIECDTSELLKEMVSANIPATMLLRHGQGWEGQVSNWVTCALTEHGEAFRSYACGALLKAATRHRDASQWFKKALNLSSSLKLRIETFLSLAQCERDVGEDLDAARKAASTALRLARKAILPKLEIKALIELGILAADISRYEQALRYYKKAENIAHYIGDTEKVGVCVGNAAIIRKNMGGRRRWIRALRDYNSALNIARAAGDKRSEGRTIGNLGILHSKMGDRTLAIRNFREAAEIARDLGDLYHEAIWLVGESDDTFSSDKIKAIDLILQARSMFLTLGSDARVNECDDHLRRFGVAPFVGIPMTHEP